MTHDLWIKSISRGKCKKGKKERKKILKTIASPFVELLGIAEGLFFLKLWEEKKASGSDLYNGGIRIRVFTLSEKTKYPPLFF